MAPKSETKSNVKVVEYASALLFELKAPVKVLKGQDAEDLVLDYMKRVRTSRFTASALQIFLKCNRAVPKTSVQKILVALAEKGELVQKTYGKTSFFVVNQANIEAIPAERFADLEAEYTAIDDENKILGAEVKVSSSGLVLNLVQQPCQDSQSSELTKLKSTPTDAELDAQILEITEAIKKADAQLQPLRSGAPLISAEDLGQLEADWMKWRAQWVRRKKIFIDFWHIATDTMAPQDATTLAEDLGIEHDTNEHSALERSPLVTADQKSLKRKR
ncbi:TBPIP-domain-containing protein [Mycena sanguinolenta]|uniref:TBPIP-domain-containing protein n=1 Tax=Mycena sanguinolenta TaxID=230812 RepID=A0A8H6ZE89_9AGAR|nr:TBPIP-domain-containing protein [Mycena sanguinolenta]